MKNPRCICQHTADQHGITVGTPLGVHRGACLVDGCVCSIFNEGRAKGELAVVQERGVGIYVARRATVRELLSVAHRPAGLMDIVNALGR